MGQKPLNQKNSQGKPLMKILEFCAITGFSSDLVVAVLRKEPDFLNTMRSAVQEKIDELQLQWWDGMAAEEYLGFAGCMLEGAERMYEARETTNFWWVSFSVQLAKCLEFLAKSRLCYIGAVQLDLQNDSKFRELHYLCKQRTYIYNEMRQWVEDRNAEDSSFWHQGFDFNLHFDSLARINKEDIILLQF
jgi:hypothetical protein